MFGIGGFELFLILLFAFLIFGPEKLPEIAKTVGRAIAKFRDAQAEVTSTLQDVAFDKNSDAPFKNPFDSADKVKASAQRGATMAKDVANSVKTSVQKSPSTETSSVEDAEATGAAEPARESFSERKARYERERKAKAQQVAETPGARTEAEEPKGKEDAAKPSPEADSDTAVKGGA